MTFRYIPVIGLEIHVQLSTATKIFCPCSTDYIGAEPNTNVCPVCLGLPGSLPVLNKRAVELGVRAGLALSCTIRNHTVFHRKNYFYPDLPKAYQISQYDLPLAEGGEIYIPGDDGRPRRIRITRLHLEEDAGKLVHSAADGRLEGAAFSFVDYNRGGVPLAEIVSEPDITSPREAREYVARIRQTVRYLGVSDGDMERGSLRVDANVSVKKTDETSGEVLYWGERTEIKNMNSLRAVERALEYEIIRQTGVLAGGGSLERETRHWNDGEGITTSMRSKEAANDYRYFPDPDLLPLDLDDELIEGAGADLPPSPLERKERYERDYSFTPPEARLFMANPACGTFFEKVLETYGNPRTLANWIFSEILSYETDFDRLHIAPGDLADFLGRIDSGEISGKIGKEILRKSFAEKRGLVEILDAEGLRQISDRGPIEEAVEAVIASFPAQAEEYRGGKSKVLGFLVGEVMKATKGKANPPLSRHLRRQYGAGLVARRRECLAAPSGRRLRHALRNQERQLDPLHRPGYRVRGPPSDRDHRGRRDDRSGDPPVRRESAHRRDAVHALEGRGARLPLFPGPGLVAARTHSGLRRRDRGEFAGASGREARPLHRRLRPDPYDADVLVSERESVDYFEEVAKGRDAKQAANWVINELFGRLNKEGLTINDSPISSGAARRHRRSHQSPGRFPASSPRTCSTSFQPRAATPPKSSRSAA